MKEENKDKRVLQVELGDNVKKVAMTGVDAADKVIMKQELNEDDLNQIDGGYVGICKILIAHAGHRCSYN